MKGIKRVVVITNVNKLRQHYPCSCHDFDLGFQLCLKAELGELSDFTIIGLPAVCSKDRVKKDVRKALEKLGFEPNYF